MGATIEALARKGWLQEGLEVKRATDLLVVLNSHETFLGLTAGAGWTVEQYKAWLYLALSDQLLISAPTADRVAAASGLSFEDELKRLTRAS
jgi:hypothetical protein